MLRLKLFLLCNSSEMLCLCSAAGLGVIRLLVLCAALLKLLRLVG